jgi:DMSO reductase anchor subunit
MRPTFSILFFTVLSGAGYGLWFLLGLAAAFGEPGCDAATAAAACATRTGGYVGALAAGFVLVSAGLLCSLGHLGKPLRAWRALSQWRSSWLSREGVAALLTYLPALGLALPLLARATGSAAFASAAALRIAGALLALGALLTVVCTANIYASLKPIRAWRDRRVVPGYLLLALYSGTLLAWLGAVLSGTAGAACAAGVLLFAAAAVLLKRSYWRSIDALPAPNAGYATGLEALGRVRSFEQPHTEENYLTHEMGFVFARKHALKLRAAAQMLGFLLPALLAVAALLMPPVQIAAAVLALPAGLLGLFVERWLFFAEARHAVAGYYAR